MELKSGWKLVGSELGHVVSPSTIANDARSAARDLATADAGTWKGSLNLSEYGLKNLEVMEQVSKLRGLTPSLLAKAERLNGVGYTARVSGYMTQWWATTGAAVSTDVSNRVNDEFFPGSPYEGVKGRTVAPFWEVGP